MQIRRITESRHQVPRDAAGGGGWCAHVEVQTMVRVETDEGQIGFGSGPPSGLEGREDLLVGRDPRDLGRLFVTLSDLSCRHGPAWALDLALWDLWGKICGQPCWRLLGGQASELALLATLPVAPMPEGLLDLAERVVAAGFGALQVRITDPDWRAQVRGLERVRRSLGAALALAIDARDLGAGAPRAWRAGELDALALALDDLDVLWLEGAPADTVGRHGQQTSCRPHLAGGGASSGLETLEGLAVRRTFDVLRPDLVRAGGITGLARLAWLAAPLGVSLVPRAAADGIGLLANAHLTAGTGSGPYLAYPCDPEDWLPARRDFALTRPIGHRNGILELPDTPGLGVELDEARLRATRIA